MNERFLQFCRWRKMIYMYLFLFFMISITNQRSINWSCWVIFLTEYNYFAFTATKKTQLNIHNTSYKGINCIVFYKHRLHTEKDQHIRNQQTERKERTGLYKTPPQNTKPQVWKPIKIPATRQTGEATCDMSLTPSLTVTSRRPH